MGLPPPDSNYLGVFIRSEEPLLQLLRLAKLQDTNIYIYIYIICVPTRNRNNEFILEFILHEIKMANFERRQFEFGLEFVR